MLSSDESVHTLRIGLSENTRNIIFLIVGSMLSKGKRKFQFSLFMKNQQLECKNSRRNNNKCWLSNKIENSNKLQNTSSET